MSSSLYLYAQIERCLRLARQVDDSLTQQRLRKLADEYKVQAEAADIIVLRINR